MGTLRWHIGRRKFQKTGSDGIYMSESSIPTIRGATTPLFAETFADSNFASRNWYSIVSADRVATPAPVGSPGSLRHTWTAGQVIPSTGGMRKLFTPTDSLYIKYQIAFSSNWVGDGSGSGPHLVICMSDADDPYQGPSDTFLSMYSEFNYQSGGIRPWVRFQDNQYIDSTVSNMYPNQSALEARSTCGANGRQGYADSWDLFPNPGSPDFGNWSHGYYNSRNLLTPSNVMAQGNTAWHTVEIETVLNTVVGGIGQLNGIVRFWWDGVLQFERTNLIMRTGSRPNIRFNQFSFSSSMGAPSPVTQSLYVADLDVRVARNISLPGVVTVSAFDSIRMSESGSSGSLIVAPRDFYFNSTEPGASIVGTNPNYLMTDDFSRGAWYEVDADHSGSPMGTLTCGWFGNIYENPITPPNAVVGGGVGLHGRTYAASSGYMDGTPGGRNMASHEFVGGVEVDEAYFRIYFKLLPGYIGGHEKQFDFIRGNNNGGLVSLSYIWGGQSVHYISYLHQDDSRPGGLSSWLGSNLAPEINPLVTDHWYFMEMHVILNTPGSYNGVYEWWMDDCGVDGTSGPVTPTRRGYYNDIMYRNSAESAVRLGGIWIENWANPGSTGTEYYANIIVSRVGPIGFAPIP